MVMNDSHAFHQAGLHLRCANNLIVLEEVLCHCYQSLLRPWLEPVYGAPTDQSRELHSTSTELLSDL